MGSHLTVDQWLVARSIVAILFSPLIALEVQKRLEDHRSHNQRRLDLFRKLMTTRATTMSPVHVESLNSIEVEFYPRRRFLGLAGPKDWEKKALDAWRLYISHLNKPMGQEEASIARWVEKKDNLLIDLLHEMAQGLGYEMERATIQNNVYHPKGFVDIETEQHALRKAALKVFSGQAPLVNTVLGPVEVSPPLPPADDAVPSSKG